jgi:hypothetical protein
MTLFLASRVAVHRLLCSVSRWLAQLDSYMYHKDINENSKRIHRNEPSISGRPNLG